MSGSLISLHREVLLKTKAAFPGLIIHERVLEKAARLPLAHTHTVFSALSAAPLMVFMSCV